MNTKETQMRKGRRAMIYLSRMFVTYEGCDWCCGGGDEIAALLLKQINKARKTGLRQRCWTCKFYDSAEQSKGPGPWGTECPKCRDYHPENSRE